MKHLNKSIFNLIKSDKMVDFVRAIKRPFTDFKKLIIVSVLNIFPIINFFSVGYSLKCAKTAMKKDFKLPELSEWGNLWVKGLFYFILIQIYLLPATAFYMYQLGFSSYLNLVLGSGSEEAIKLFGKIGLSNIIIYFSIVILIWYLIPMAVMNFIDKNNFWQAFNLKVVLRKAFTWKYFLANVFLFIYAFLAIAAFILFITAIFVLISLFVRLSLFAILIVWPLVLIIIVLLLIISTALIITYMTVFGEVYSELK